MILFISILILLLVGIYFYVSIDKSEEEISSIKSRIIRNESFYMSKSEYHLKYSSLHNRISKLEKAQKEVDLKMREDKGVGLPKYRAWVHSFSGMIQVAQIDYKEQKIWDFNRKYYRPDDLVLMQSTKFKDAKGIEIYEGDIVKRIHLFNGGYGETHTGEVVYDEEYARYVISRPQKYIEPKTEDLRNTLSDKSTYEVIGNVWENPKLLEVAE